MMNSTISRAKYSITTTPSINIIANRGGFLLGGTRSLSRSLKAPKEKMQKSDFLHLLRQTMTQDDLNDIKSTLLALDKSANNVENNAQTNIPMVIKC